MNGPENACFQWLHTSAMDGLVMDGPGKPCF